MSVLTLATLVAQAVANARVEPGAARVARAAACARVVTIASRVARVRVAVALNVVGARAVHARVDRALVNAIDALGPALVAFLVALDNLVAAEGRRRQCAVGNEKWRRAGRRGAKTTGGVGKYIGVRAEERKQWRASRRTSYLNSLSWQMRSLPETASLASRPGWPRHSPPCEAVPLTPTVAASVTPVTCTDA